jgi:hypothetical protein
VKEQSFQRDQQNQIQHLYSSHHPTTNIRNKFKNPNKLSPVFVQKKNSGRNLAYFLNKFFVFGLDFGFRPKIELQDFKILKSKIQSKYEFQKDLKKKKKLEKIENPRYCSFCPNDVKIDQILALKKSRCQKER